MTMKGIQMSIDALIQTIAKDIEECLAGTHTCGYCHKRYTPSEMGGNEHFCSMDCMDASLWERYEEQCPLDTIDEDDLFEDIPEEYEENLYGEEEEEECMHDDFTELPSGEVVCTFCGLIVTAQS